jgi:hypothetical protein
MQTAGRKAAEYTMKREEILTAELTPDAVGMGYAALLPAVQPDRLHFPPINN